MLGRPTVTAAVACSSDPDRIGAELDGRRRTATSSEKPREGAVKAGKGRSGVAVAGSGGWGRPSAALLARASPWRWRHELMAMAAGLQTEGGERLEREREEREKERGHARRGGADLRGRLAARRPDDATAGRSSSGGAPRRGNGGSGALGRGGARGDVARSEPQIWRSDGWEQRVVRVSGFEGCLGQIWWSSGGWLQFSKGGNPNAMGRGVGLFIGWVGWHSDEKDPV